MVVADLKPGDVVPLNGAPVTVDTITPDEMPGYLALTFKEQRPSVGEAYIVHGQQEQRLWDEG